jgi:hypothetical protein
MNTRIVAAIFRYLSVAAIAIPIGAAIAWAMGILTAGTTSEVSFGSAICGAVFVMAYFIATDYFLEQGHQRLNNGGDKAVGPYHDNRPI